MDVLQSLSWVDWTSLAIVTYFLIVGLFRGFLWQASRLASIVLAWLLASVFAGDLAMFLARTFRGLEGHASYYVAFFSILVAVLVVLSLITILLDRIIRELRLSFYNHVGGGLLGVATAAALIVAVLGLLYRLMPESHFVALARSSLTGDLSRQLVERAGLPEEIQVLYRKAEPAGPEEHDEVPHGPGELRGPESLPGGQGGRSATPIGNERTDQNATPPQESPRPPRPPGKIPPAKAEPPGHRQPDASRDGRR